MSGNTASAPLRTNLLNSLDRSTQAISQGWDRAFADQSVTPRAQTSPAKGSCREYDGGREAAPLLEEEEDRPWQAPAILTAAPLLLLPRPRRTASGGAYIADPTKEQVALLEEDAEDDGTIAAALLILVLLLRIESSSMWLWLCSSCMVCLGFFCQLQHYALHVSRTNGCSSQYSSTCMIQAAAAASRAAVVLLLLL